MKSVAYTVEFFSDWSKEPQLLKNYEATMPLPTFVEGSKVHAKPWQLDDGTGLDFGILTVSSVTHAIEERDDSIICRQLVTLMESDYGHRLQRSAALKRQATS